MVKILKLLQFFLMKNKLKILHRKYMKIGLFTEDNLLSIILKKKEEFILILLNKKDFIENLKTINIFYLSFNDKLISNEHINLIKEYKIPIILPYINHYIKILGAEYLGFYKKKDIQKVNHLLDIKFKNHLIITITTYQRNSLLNFYLHMLDKQEKIKKFIIKIYDDFPSNKNLILYKPKNYKLYYHNHKNNYGKKNYYINFCKNIRNIAYFTNKYLFSCDDLLITNKFLYLSLKYWESINDKNKIVLTLLNDRIKSWINKKNENYNDTVLRSYWQETLFICNNKFIDEYYDLSSKFLRGNATGSGVPGFFSKNNYKKKYNMYVIKNNILKNIGNFFSKMNNFELKLRLFRKYKKKNINILLLSNSNIYLNDNYIKKFKKINFINFNVLILEKINEFDNIIKKYKPDILILENLYFLELLLKKNYNFKVIVNIHEKINSCLIKKYEEIVINIINFNKLNSYPNNLKIIDLCNYNNFELYSSIIL